jgi:hypothetical protein
LIVLRRVKEKRNILQTKRRKDDWIGHILHENCLLKHIIEGKIGGRIEAKGRRGRRRKKLLDDLKGKREYWKPKEERVCLLVCRTHEMRFTLQGLTAHFCKGLLAVLSRCLDLLVFV